MDLENERQVSSEQGKDFAKKIGCAFMEASAKTNTNVKEIFFQLVRMINEWKEKNPQKSLDPEKRGKKKKDKCYLM